VWASVFALLFHSLFLKFRQRLGGRDNVAAGLTVLFVTTVAIVPAIWFGALVAAETGELAGKLQDGELDLTPVLDNLRDVLPVANGIAEDIGLNTDDLGTRLSESFVSGGEFIASRALIVGQGAFRALLLLSLTIYLLFFLLRDGRNIATAVYAAIPLQPGRKSRLTQRIGQVTRATVKGMFIIGIAQGAVGTITFALLGIPGAMLVGLAMAVASLLPALGTALIWVPVAVFLAVSGAWIKASILALVGALLIGLLDNLLRPYLVGHDTRIPDYMILLSTLGGLGLFGLSGFVIGPIIAGMFLTCWSLAAGDPGDVADVTTVAR
jgi:predicted PurR-regulated permease PerM